MREVIGFLIIFLSSTNILNCQLPYSVVGRIIDNTSEKELQGVHILIMDSTIEVRSDWNGNFELTKIVKPTIVLKIILEGYEPIKIPVTASNNTVKLDLGTIRLSNKLIEELNSGLIELSKRELQDGERVESNNISGFMVSSKDVFMKTVAYEFSATFFRPRSLGSEYTEILLNGVSMNKIYNNRPQWSNWGGLNDVMRNQEFSANLHPSRVSFGGIGGTLNITTLGSHYRKGVKLSYAMSNRSYKGRIMATFSSGLSDKGWAYTISASKRYANEGFREGTLYNANSFFASVENRINDKNKMNFTIIYTRNTRGKSSPITQEVFNLKSIKYNSYWGNQEGEIRNSRIRTIEEPIIQMNYFWKKHSKFSIQTNITYQFGKISNSRLDYGGTRIVLDGNENQSIIGGGLNPDPTYYQKLPSYFLKNSSNPDYTKAYLAQDNFIKYGQIDWQALYNANRNMEEQGANAIYALYEDRTDDKQLSINSILYFRANKFFSFNGSVGYRTLKSENYARINDLLGGSGFLDVDVYGGNVDEAQNDLQNLNRIVGEGQKFKYNYNLGAIIVDGFLQGQYNTKRIETFFALDLSTSRYQRTGLYENGAYPQGHSYGKSDRLNFTNYGVKGGLMYKLSGRHLFTLNASYITRAPNTKNTFSNIRENNDIVIGLENEKISALDIGYLLRHPRISLKFNAYWLKLEDMTQISFYYADGLTGLNNTENTAFVQEIMTDTDRENIGIEFGIEWRLLPGLKLKGVAAVGQSVFSNNPNLYLTSDGFEAPLNYGKTNLKNYFTAGGPQRAYSVGFEYNDPKYWWFGATINYFSNAYSNVAPIIRTKNFYTDTDGLPFNNYDPDIARELLRQQKFDDYFLVNIVGGKSWKIKQYYFGFFANVSNLLNTIYKTGGYEQSRNANYETLLEDKSRDYPLFGPKYWFGYGTSFYVSINFRL